MPNLFVVGQTVRE